MSETISSLRHNWGKTLNDYMWGLLILILLIRVGLFMWYATTAVPEIHQIAPLEGTNVHFIWRVQNNLFLYPNADNGTYIANTYAPVQFWICGYLGKLYRANITQLYTIGRCVTCGSTVLVAFLAAGFLLGSTSWKVAAIGLVYGLSAGPLYGLGISSRPDMLAELLGITGFLLATSGQFRTSLFCAIAFLVVSCLTKQTAGVYLIAASLVLLQQPNCRSRAMVLFAGSVVTLVLVIVFVQTFVEPHFIQYFFAQGGSSFSFSQMATMLSAILWISPDMILLTIVGIWMWMRSNHSVDQRKLLLALVLFVISLMTSAKMGSSVNYYMGLRFVAIIAFGDLAHHALSNRMSQLYASCISLLVLVAVLQNTWTFGSGILDANRRRLANNIANFHFHEIHDEQLARLAMNRVPLLTTADQLSVYQGDEAMFHDSYLFRLRVENESVDPAKLVVRIQREEFRYLVLKTDLFSSKYGEAFWRLPGVVADAARNHYRFQDRSGGFFVYIPNSSSGSHVGPNSSSR